MKFKILWVFCFSIALTSLSGCNTIEAMKESKNKNDIKLIENSNDQIMLSSMRDAFLTAYKQRVFEDIIILGSKGYTKGHLDELIEKASKHDDTADDISAMYIKIAKERGSIIKVYKPLLNNNILSLFKRSSMFISKMDRGDLSRAIIEYDNQGRIISALTRVHRFSPSIARWDYFFESSIYTGNSAVHIENQISNSVFEESYLSSY